MKKSRTDTAETRKRIVSAASRVFVEQGLAATGIADVMTAAGMTQGGFYRHFESKEQLIAEANQVASDQLLALFADAAAGLPPREALLAIVDLYLDESQEVANICPLANLASELCHSDDCIKAAALGGYQRMLADIAARTRLLDIANHGCVADALVSTMVGAVTLSRLAPEGAMGRTILRNARIVAHEMLNGQRLATADEFATAGR